MSRSAKVFFGSSVVLTAGVIYGVHWLQKRESDTMYQGVLRDDARLKEKALKLAQAALPASIAEALPSPASSSSSSSPSSSSSSSTSPSSSSSARLSNQANSLPPLNTPSAPIQQPAPTLDPSCETCHISPPPQLLESQSADIRRQDREARAREYAAQKDLGERLGREQSRGGGVGWGEEGGRLV